MLKVIKKYEVEVVEASGMVMVDVYPRPLAIPVKIARHAINARTFQRLSDTARDVFIRESVLRCLTMLQEKADEND